MRPSDEQSKASEHIRHLATRIAEHHQAAPDASAREMVQQHLQPRWIDHHDERDNPIQLLIVQDMEFRQTTAATMRRRGDKGPWFVRYSLEGNLLHKRGMLAVVGVGRDRGPSGPDEQDVKDRTQEELAEIIAREAARIAARQERDKTKKKP